MKQTRFEVRTELPLFIMKVCFQQSLPYLQHAFNECHHVLPGWWWGGDDGDGEGGDGDEGDDEDEDDLEPPVHSVFAVNQCRQPRASWQFDV